MSPRLCLLEARADHLCLDALNVVLRSLRGVKVDEESGVVVARRGVTLGAIVTLGRVEERRVDAWDWALALSGIFVARAAARGPRCSKGFRTRRVRYAVLCAFQQRLCAAGRSETSTGLTDCTVTAVLGARARFCLDC